MKTDTCNCKDCNCNFRNYNYNYNPYNCVFECEYRVIPQFAYICFFYLFMFLISNYIY